MNLDMGTAFYINTICNLLALLLMLLYRQKHKNFNNCAPCFILFYVFFIISSLMITYRADLGSFLSIVAANSFIVSAFLLMNSGILKVVNKPFNKRFFIGMLTSFIMLFIVFTYLYNSILIRIIVINAYVIIISIKSMIDLQQSKLKFSLIDEFMSVLLMLYSLVALSRIIFNFIFIDTNTDFLNFTIDPIFILITSLINLMFLSGILSLYNNDFVSKYIESERKSNSLISNLPGFAYRCLNDEFWTMKYVSNQFKTITGYDVKDIIDNHKLSYDDLIADEDKNIVRNDWKKVVEKKTKYTGEYSIIKKDGTSSWVWEQGIPIYEPDGSCKYLEGFIMDISDRKTMEDNLKFLSYNDTLTSLHNRRYMNIKLEEFEKSKNYPLTLIMGDINGLKFINDMFGHNVGDQVLIFVANCISNVIQNDDLVSRVSGDEFIILLESTDESVAEKIITDIHNQVDSKNPFDFNVSISLGYFTTSDSNLSLKQIQKNAEDYMYMQKTYAKPSIQRKAIDAVLKTLNEKDQLSEQHSKNVAKYAKRLAKKLNMNQQKIDMVETAALLHDVGKIIIHENILTSTKKLTAEEYNEIKKHPEIGYRILNSVPELSRISEIILYHHERIDGKGYPKGLKGEDIPYISKIISICDAFDAMVNVRLYREPLPLEAAIKELKKNSNTQFDEKLVDVFVKNIEYIMK